MNGSGQTEEKQATQSTAEENAATGKKRKHTLKRALLAVLLALGALLLLVGISTVLYLADYYRAEPRVAAEMATLHKESRLFGEDGDTLVFPAQNDALGSTALIFYPGGKVEYTAYVPLGHQLAQRGITCFLVRMPGNLAIADIDRADDIIASHPEIDTWYIGGHSLGGAAAAMYLKEHPSACTGLVLLAAYATDDLSQSGIDVLSVYGTEDGVLDRETYADCLNHLPAGYREQVIEGGCHAGFGCYGAQEGDGQPSITGDAQQTITADAIRAWMAQTEGADAKR